MDQRDRGCHLKKLYSTINRRGVQAGGEESRSKEADHRMWSEGREPAEKNPNMERKGEEASISVAKKGS